MATTTKKNVTTKRSASIVAKARATHHGVRVAGKEYGSVFQAFEALKLPIWKHKKFRKELKAKKTLPFVDGKKKLTFSIVEKKAA